MRIFISWSKEPSKTIAEALRDWLPDVIQSVEPWISSADIGAGARWSGDIAKALAETKIGIICVTSQNQAESWLNFEAGALAKTLEGTLVCPYLINMRTSDLKGGPLTQFQAKTADEKGTWELIQTINGASTNGPLAEDRLRRLFERAWPDLQKKLVVLPPPPQPTHRNSDEILVEVLDTVRTLAREANDSRDLSQLYWSELSEALRELRGARPEPQGQGPVRWRQKAFPIPISHEPQQDDGYEADNVAKMTPQKIAVPTRQPAPPSQKAAVPPPGKPLNLPKNFK